VTYGDLLQPQSAQEPPREGMPARAGARYRDAG